MPIVLLRAICPLLLATVVCGGNWSSIPVVAPAVRVTATQTSAISGANPPRVCAYLAIVNGTRIIDPGFAGSPLPSPNSTKSASVTEATAATAGSSYCHPLPPLLLLQGDR